MKPAYEARTIPLSSARVRASSSDTRRKPVTNSSRFLRSRMVSGSRCPSHSLSRVALVSELRSKRMPGCRDGPQCRPSRSARDDPGGRFGREREPVLVDAVEAAACAASVVVDGVRLLYLWCLGIVGMPSRHPPSTRIGTLRHTPLYDGPCFPNDFKGLPTIPR